MSSVRTWFTPAAIASGLGALVAAPLAAIALNVEPAPAPDQLVAHNVVTEDGGLYVQTDGYDLYDPATNTFSTGYASQGAINTAASKAMYCRPSELTLCYRALPGALGIQESTDGGGTWNTAWEVSDADTAVLTARFAALTAPGDAAPELYTRAVAVAEEPGGYVVVGADGIDGLVVRHVDGTWERVGIPGGRAALPLASDHVAGPLALPLPLVWALVAFALTLVAAGELRWTRDRGLARAAVGWAFAAVGIAALVVATAHNQLSPIPEANPAHPALLQSAVIAFPVILLLFAAAIGGGIPQGRGRAAIVWAGAAGLAAAGVAAIALTAGASQAVARVLTLAAVAATIPFNLSEVRKGPVAPPQPATVEPEWLHDLDTVDPTTAPATHFFEHVPTPPEGTPVAPGPDPKDSPKRD